MRERISTDNAAKLAELKKVPCGQVAYIDWSPDGKILAVAGGETVRLYAGTFGDIPTHTLAAQIGDLNDVAFGLDNTALVAVGDGIRVWDISDIYIAIDTAAVLRETGGEIHAVRFNPRGDQFVTSDSQGHVSLWDAATYECITRFEGHKAAVYDVAFALRGNVIVSGGADGTIRFWDARAETEGTVIGTHKDRVNVITVNPPGTMVASACADGTVRLWDALSGEQYAEIFAHTGGAVCVTFSPYGELMVTGGADGVLRVWNVQRILTTGTAGPADALATLAGHEGAVKSVIFNPPGTFLASGGEDATVRLWDIPGE